jgi:hypothetical protein
MKPRIAEDDLVRIISGDVERIHLLTSQADVMRLASQIPKGQRTLTADTVKRVLIALLQRRISPEQAQRWASFVRWGLIPTAEMKVNAIEIPKQEDCEDKIVDSLARLDELGDIIDGSIDDAELRELIEDLSKRP